MKRVAELASGGAKVPCHAFASPSWLNRCIKGVTKCVFEASLACSVSDLHVTHAFPDRTADPIVGCEDDADMRGAAKRLLRPSEPAVFSPERKFLPEEPAAAPSFLRAATHAFIADLVISEDRSTVKHFVDPDPAQIFCFPKKFNFIKASRSLARCSRSSPRNGDELLAQCSGKASKAARFPVSQDC